MHDLDSLSLSELVQRVCDQGDREALRFLVERPLFRSRSRGNVRLDAFIEELVTTSRDVPTYVLERARDLTIDKFSQLPSDSGGIDCRHYYRALGNSERTLAGESQISSQLRGLVRRHFALSLREAARSSPLLVRHQWKERGTTLWFPRNTESSEREQWIEENAGGKNAIELQELIHESFTFPHLVALSEAASHPADQERLL
ncbi:MAG: hypothetical protein AAF517_10775, partial [Planctomycetota bacterium]